MAADPGLVRYVKEQMDAGFRKAQIYEVLLQAGWYKEEIDEAFYPVVNLTLGKPEPPQASVQDESKTEDIPEKPGFLWKLASSLAHPGRLFEAVKKEKDLGKSLRFYCLLSFVHLVILLVSFFVSEAISSGFLPASPIAFIAQMIPFVTLTAIVMIFFGYSLFLAMPFIAEGIIHFFVYMFRGGRGFSSTFKAVVYSLAPTLLVWPVMLLYFLAAGLTPYLADILLLLIAAWMLCLLVKGLKKLHGISTVKAVLAVLAPLMIAAAIIIVMTLSVLLSYFSFYGIQPQEPLNIIDFSYSYEGNLSLAFRNFLESPLTINAVSVGCGQGGAPVYLDSSGLTHLQPGDSIAYSTMTERCLSRNPGERYSINVTIRYMDESNYVQVFSKEIEGNIV